VILADLGHAAEGDPTMKHRVVVLACVALSLLACAGAGDPCGQLACDKCENKGTKMACDALVRSDNDKACEIALTKPDFKTCQ
jgi:hypothetical protein